MKVGHWSFYLVILLDLVVQFQFDRQKPVTRKLLVYGLFKKLSQLRQDVVKGYSGRKCQFVH